MATPAGTVCRAQSSAPPPTVFLESTSVPAHPPAGLLPGPWWPEAQRSKLKVNQEFQEGITYGIWPKVQRDGSPSLAGYILCLLFFPFPWELKGAGGSVSRMYE